MRINHSIKTIPNLLLKKLRGFDYMPWVLNTQTDWNPLRFVRVNMATTETEMILADNVTLSPIYSCISRGAVTILRYLSLMWSFFELQLTLDCPLWIFTVEIILRWKKFGLATWNIHNSFTSTVALRARFLFYPLY